MNASMQQRIFGAKGEVSIIAKIDEDRSRKYETLGYDKNGRLVRLK
jgi:hypothetical protein